MKTKILLLPILMLSLMSSCKKGNEPESAKPVEAVKQNFSVELDVTAKGEDNFAVYYTEDGTINFKPESTVWSGVKASNELQKVVFNLPEEAIPTHIRIDFGIKNKEAREDVTLEKFKVSYYDKSFEARGSDFLKYFIKNDSIETTIDEVKGTVTFKKNTKNSVTPFFYPNKPIVDEIEKLTK